MVATGGIESEEFLQQQRRGPAVEQDVVVGDDQRELVVSLGCQGETQQRRGRQVESLQPVGLGESGEVLVGVGRVGEVQFVPGHLDVREDDLHRGAVRAGDERCAQVVVAVDDALGGGAQPRGIDLTGEVDDGLHRVDVDRGLCQQSVEEQARLQRRQRPDVDKAGVTRFPGGQVVLDDRNQREI
ncbi:hypothetical protein LAUMK35_05671 [Mycobacterium pseudokansasii]|nr:hypothetical protein LAUMK35_05671 [Mycobacterium pseudokansasii]VBA35666.1 hypothetical protein LAUMK21_05652 [Mycobacterium pseudokansasii]